MEGSVSCDDGAHWEQRAVYEFRVLNAWCHPFFAILLSESWCLIFFFLALVKALAVQGQYCVLRKRHIDWRAVSLQRKDNYPPHPPVKENKKYEHCILLIHPLLGQYITMKCLFLLVFYAPLPPSLKWPIPSAPIFVCRPARLVYFTAIPSTSPSRSVVSHCFSASVGNRRNHRCRLLGPQQRWGAV